MSLKSIGNIVGEFKKTQDVYSFVNDFKELSNFQKNSVLGSLPDDLAAALANAADFKKVETEIGTAGNVAAAGTSTWGAALSGIGATLKAALPYLAVIGGIGTAIALVNSQVQKYNNLKEKSEESGSVYDSTQSELESVNTELTTTQNRIKELQNLSATGKLSLTDEAELQTLQQQNTELERKQKLLQTQSNVDLGKSISDSSTLLTDKTKAYFDTNLSGTGGTSINKRNVVDDMTANLKEMKSAETELKKLQEERRERQESGFFTGSIDKDIEKQEKKVEKYKSKVEEEAADIQDARNRLAEGVNSAWWNDDYQKTLDAADAALTKYESDMSNATPLQKDLNSLNSFFNNGSENRTMLQSTILDEMAESGRTASEVIASLGLSLDDLGVENVENLNRYFSDLATSAEEVNKKAKEVDGTFEGMAKAAESENEGANFEKLGEYLTQGKDLYSKGLIGTDDFKTIAKFIDPDGKGYKKDFNKNYEKLQRYFTTNDDGEYTRSGIDSFVSDLASSGKQFKNTAEVADELGISVRSVEAIMGRLGDYDITKYGSFKIKDIEQVSQAYDQASSNLEKLKTVRDGITEEGTKSKLTSDIDEFDKYMNSLDGDLSKFDPEIAVKIKAELDEAQIRATIANLKLLLEGDPENTEYQAELYAANENLIKTQEKNNKWKLNNGKYKSWTPDEYVQSRNAISNTNDTLREKQGTLTDEQKGTLRNKRSQLQEANQAILDSYEDSMKAGDSVAKWRKKAKKEGLFAELQDLNDEVNQTIKDLDGDTSSKRYKKNKRKKSRKDSEDDDSSDNSRRNRKKNRNKDIDDSDDNSSETNNRTKPKKSGKVPKQDKSPKKNVEIDVNGTAQDAITQVATELADIPEDVAIELSAEGNASDEAVKTASEISGIPEEKLTRINAQDGAQGVLAAVLAKITGIPESVWTAIFAQDSASGVAVGVASALDSVDNKDVTISAADTATPIVANVEAEKIKDKTFTISANDNASGILSSIIGKLAGIKSKAVSVTTTYKTNGVAARLNGNGGKRGSASGTAYHLGTSFANGSGNWSVGQNTTSLVNEVGPEIIARKGHWFIHNGGKPSFVKLQKDDIVFNASQTRHLLQSGRASSYGKFIGASNADGTIGGLSFASGSGDDKKLSNFQDWFGKFFDWIEIRLSRVEQKIDNVITKAESAMTQQRWERSQSLYRKGISYTIGQIGRETTVQGRYKSKADSVLNRAVSQGLINKKQSKAIRKQVKDGSLNIKAYGDRMQEVIKDYKEFYDKSLDAADAIQELKDKVLDYVDALEELHEKQMQAKLDTLNSLDDINTSTQNYTAAAKMAQLRYSNDNLEKQNEAYKNRVAETKQDYAAAQSSASKAAGQQAKAKRHKGTSKAEYNKYKKAVKSAQAAIKAGREVSSSDLAVIENYAKKTTGKTSQKNANKLAAKIIKYNAERQALDEAKLARDVAVAENNADIISNIQDIYEAMDDEANDQIDLLESQADVATTLEEKNKLLSQASKLYDTMLQNDDAEIAEYQTGVNKASANIAKSTAYGGAIDSADSATRAKVEELVNECKRRASSGEDITDDMIAQLAEYNSKGYVWRSFYNACLQYHQYYQAKLQAEAQKKIDEASFKAEKEALAYQAFQNIQDSYERQQRQYDNEASIIDSQQSKNQALGYGDSAEYYAAKQKAQLAQNESMRQELNALKSSLSDLTVGSDEYYDALDAINDLTVALIDGEAAVAEYQQSINQLNWDRFDELQERISNLTNETDFLIDLLSYKDLQDKDTGNDTEAGKAVKALHVQNYQTYTQQAKDYAEAIKELDAQFADDSLNKDYLERRQELVEAQQDAILSAQDEKEALIGLVQDGYDAQLDALDELISKYEDALNAQKDMYDYQQNIRDITKDISKYQKQLQAYQLDDSEEAKQRIQKANQDLLDAQQDLSDAEYDQYISAAQELLSDLSDELSDHFDDVIDSLRDNADDLINSIDTSSADVSATIKDATDSVGYTLSDSMTKIWGTDSEYGTISASVSAAVTGIKTLSSDINAAADKVAQTILEQGSGTAGSGSSDVTGYASGGVVPNAKKILSRNGDSEFTINTLKAGERILTPEQNQIFEKLISFAPDLVDVVNELPKVSVPVDLQNNVSQIDISSPINIEFTLPNVQNYSEFMTEMQKDKRVEKWLTSMLVNPLTGKSSIGKNNIRF